MIGTITAWITRSKLWGALTGLLAGLVMLLATYLAGKRSASVAASHEALEAYVKTKERIHEVEPAPTRDANLERLRRKGLVRPSDL